MSADALATAIRLLTALDHLRGEVARTVTALEPLAEVHPYVATHLDRLRAALDHLEAA